MKARMSLTQQHSYRFGEFELSVGARCLYRDREPVALGSKAFDVLTCLVAHAGRVVTKEEMLRTVWPDSFVEEGNLAQHVVALRRALGDQAGWIKTVPGRGYLFTADVRELVLKDALLEETAHGHARLGEGVTVQHTVERAQLVIEESAPPPEARAVPASPPAVYEGQRSLRRIFLYVLVAAVLAGGAILVGWKFWRRQTARPYLRATLADFGRGTGDATLDHSLRRALAIDLEQSPYLGIMTDADAVRVLKMMGRKGDDALTPEVAAEVCERGNRDVLLTAGIEPVGSVYLLTLQAADCHTGKRLASAEAKARNREEILDAIDNVATRARTQLGEAAGSVAHYDKPIAEATTASLEALKDFSMGLHLFSEGKDETEILPYYQRALQLDPQFAMAYGAMASMYYNASEQKLATQYLQKAFDLRARTSAKESLIIEAHYYSEGLGDIQQGIRTYRVWAATYPFDPVPWIDLANDYTQIGQYPAAIEAGERALQLSPDQAVMYVVMMRAYRRQNRLAEAKSTGMLALQRGKASPTVHAILYEIAHWEQDSEAQAREIAWGEQNPGEYYFLYDRAEAAFFSGRYTEAKRLFEASHEAAAREGLPEAADSVLVDLAQFQLDFGMTGEARATLARVLKPDPDSPDEAMLRTRLGDLPYGHRFLDRQEGMANQPTLVKTVQLPLMRASLAMHEGKPFEAIAALEAARPYELSGFALLRARGEANLLAKQPKAAAAEFQAIVDHYGIDTISPSIPLAHLGLARAYAMSGDTAASRREYEKLFALWKNGDAGVPALQQARAEYAEIAPGTSEPPSRSGH
jgi:DNA-binding winged helix-turn-helix (wHTH) protein/tetratricopeptide (TPR) repeat protein